MSMNATSKHDQFVFPWVFQMRRPGGQVTHLLIRNLELGMVHVRNATKAKRPSGLFLSEHFGKDLV